MSFIFDPVAARCAVLAAHGSAKVGNQDMEFGASYFAADQRGGISQALYDLIIQASNAARAYERECRMQGIQPREDIMALKVADANDLAAEAFGAVIFPSPKNVRADAFFHELAKRGLRIVFADAPTT